MVFLATSCGSDDPEPVSCENGPEASVKTMVNTSVCNAADGEIVLEAVGGIEPITYSIDGGTSFQSSPTFTGLPAGIYFVIVKDANECKDDIEVTLESGDTDLAATAESTADTQCFEDNGVIQIEATGGQAPYQYNIGEGFTTTGSFMFLAPGDYEVVVKDAVDCTVSVAVNVERGDTGTSYQSDVGPIIMASCAIPDCHNGDNGASQDWTDFGRVQQNAEVIKTRTQNGSMPPSGDLTSEEIALITCWVEEGAQDN